MPHSENQTTRPSLAPIIVGNTAYICLAAWLRFGLNDPHGAACVVAGGMMMKWVWIGYRTILPAWRSA